MGIHNIEDWLVEAEIPPLAGQPDPGGMQAPGSTPDMPNAAGLPPSQNAGEEMDDPTEVPDTSNDPHAPDMPEEKADVGDFESWRMQYFRELLKGDSNHMIDMIHQVRDRDLDEYQRKFVEDNLQINILRQDSNIEKVSKDVIKNVKNEINKNSPGVSLVNHIALALEANPVVNSIFIKLNGLWGAKGDLHRKFLASLLNAAQVGSGGVENEDIVYNDNDFSVQISTRCNSKFGSIMLGSWSLKEDDPERYLQPPELKRLQEGSPEEKDVLRRRVVIESIINKFKTRAFITTITNTEGTIYNLGIDLSEMLQSSYKDGKLLVRTTEAENSEAMIDDDGKILPYIDLNIKYAKPTGRQTPEGKPEIEELEFLERINGQLFISGSLQTMQDAATSLAGIVLKELPYSGNPTDLHAIERCVPSVAEILLRRCG